MVAQDEIFIHHFISSYSLEIGELQPNPIWPDRKIQGNKPLVSPSNPANETGFLCYRYTTPDLAEVKRNLKDFYCFFLWFFIPPQESP